LRKQRRKKATEYLNELAVLLKAQFFTAAESDKLRRGAKLERGIAKLRAGRKDVNMAKTYVAIRLLPM